MSQSLMMLPLACLALAATTPAMGEVYKWVDENGAMHYADAPPGKNKATFKRLDKEALAVSRAKTPKQEVLQQISQQASQQPEQQTVQDLNSKVTALEHQIEVEQQARQTADAKTLATQAAYTQALADQQTARNVGYIPTIPAASGVLLLSPSAQKHPDNCRSMATGTAVGCTQPEHWQRPPTVDRTH